MVNLGFDHALAQWCTTAGGGGGSKASGLLTEYDIEGPRPGSRPMHTVYISDTSANEIDTEFLERALVMARDLMQKYRQDRTVKDVTDDYSRIIVTRFNHLLLGSSTKSFLHDNRDHQYLEIKLKYVLPPSYNLNWHGESKRGMIDTEATTAIFKRVFSDFVGFVVGTNAKRVAVNKIWRSPRRLVLGTSGAAITVRKAAIEMGVQGVDFIPLIMGGDHDTILAEMADISVEKLRELFC